MLKPLIALSISAGLLTCNVSVAQAETFSCHATRNTVDHFMEVTIQNGTISTFDYSSSTPVAGSVNNCLVASNGAKVTQSSNGAQVFALPNDDTVTVSKKGKQFVFDFSKVSLSDFCGQSSTMATHLTITPGVKRCSGIDNF
ncbi:MULTISPECIES: hypothetical protein [Paraburkholderia]|jgi:hypothetical protein|uniref:Uncharacterized protein n=1 Tax=Paraburkholderia phenazinium TaxID=60549 RepID=A0A1N6L6Z0_9BURK|nr:hypothetical protein [Paraburkholderia phenazinium]SIO64528.1 hypothetical protein SAMN05444165_6299 [Paraburkholderia phenazinium]